MFDPKNEIPLRVFISYSHQDASLAEKIVKSLIANGITPMWDKNFLFGFGFHSMIKTFISHSHVFLPIITESSNSRGWVHQEIGYAVAMNIPVLPVAAGELPQEMIYELHALQLSKEIKENDRELQALFTQEMFEALITKYRKSSHGLYVCAERHEERSILMAEYADEVLSLHSFGMIRQKGGLSSFHIPDKEISDPVWEERYGNYGKSPFQADILRNERIALAKHAERAGCKLIISDGKYIETELEKLGRYNSLTARKSRLNTLRIFLESMPPGKVEIAIKENLDSEQSITIVGDWFAAESFSRSIKEGYRQTMFTRHAPSIMSRIKQFDEEFDSITGNIPREDTKALAIEKIGQFIDEIDNELSSLKETGKRNNSVGSIPLDG